MNYYHNDFHFLKHQATTTIWLREMCLTWFGYTFPPFRLKKKPNWPTLVNVANVCDICVSSWARSFFLSSYVKPRRGEYKGCSQKAPGGWVGISRSWPKKKQPSVGQRKWLAFCWLKKKLENQRKIFLTKKNQSQKKKTANGEPTAPTKGNP